MVCIFCFNHISRNVKGCTYGSKTHDYRDTWYVEPRGGARSNKKPVSKSVRNAVYKRDGKRCRYCGTDCIDSIRAKTRITLYHIIPECRGGTKTIDNLVVACNRCNVKKGNCTPTEAGMVVLPAPDGSLPPPVVAPPIRPKVFQTFAQMSVASKPVVEIYTSDDFDTPYPERFAPRNT